MQCYSREAVVVLLLEDELVGPAEGVGAAGPLALGQVAPVWQDEVGALQGPHSIELSRQKLTNIDQVLGHLTPLSIFGSV